MAREKRQIEISATQGMRKSRAMKFLRRPLFLTRLGMFAERITRAFWPLWSIGFVLWSVLAFWLVETVPPWVAQAGFAVTALAALWFAMQGLRKFRWPGQDHAALRLDATLPSRPLTAMWDQQVLGLGDAASTAMWRAHVARMTEQAASARAVAPDLKISGLDPFGLRYVAATAFVMALIFGNPDPDADLGNLLGTAPAQAMAQGPIYEGWIEPPRYTGLPAIYLNEVKGDDPLPVPQGSKVTLRLYGETGDLGVRENLSGLAPVTDGAPVSQLDFVVTQSGDLTVTSKKGNDIGWRIVMTPDTPPVITATGLAERSPSGETKLPFSASDDYGVTHGTARITLDMATVDRRYGLVLEPEPVAPVTLDLPLPYNGSTDTFKETLVEDLSKHPWAGLPVALTLTANDAIDQTGTNTPEIFALPGRRFFDPMAAALVEQRRDLLWNRDNAQRIALVLRALTYLPEDIFDSQKAYLTTRSVIRRLEINAKTPLTDKMRDELAEALWKAALQLEDGDLADAEARLKRAQERLSEAIKNGATEEEIAKLAEDMRRAMRDYMEKLAREAEQNPDQQQSQDGEQQEITQEQLQEMLDRIQDLMREGRTEEAQALLEQLSEMMRNMQMAQRQQGEGQGQGQQAMRDLQETLRQQQGLSDEAFKRLQEQFNSQRQQGQNGQQGQQQPGQQGQQGNQGEQGQPGGEGNQNGNDQPRALSDRELAERQEALRDMLESQRNGLPDAGNPEGRAARDALERAERSMGDAGRSLDKGDISQALNEQSDALDALREGIESLGQEMARNQSDNMGRQGDQAGRPDPNSERDPLGRQAGSVGRLGSDENLLNGKDPYLRSRELLDEIRRRTGEKSRPKIELEYLERLLDRF
jgi:uncharacterized protein (TIGR02302 family)